MPTSDTPPVIFNPNNEPYLGRTLLHQFDKLISSCLEHNSSIAPKTHHRELTETQQMACVVIPQTISIALSIRELLRQGYLFGAKVLIRPLVERSAMLLYIHTYPKEIEKWARGWKHGDAPSLSKMLESIQGKTKHIEKIKGYELTDEMNSLLHCRPESGLDNLVKIDGDRAGYAPSKILNRPDLCDDICANVIPWFVVVQTMMVAYFENDITT